MKELRNLKRQLEEVFSIQDGYALAEQLVLGGVHTITEEHRQLVTYLQQVCVDFSFDNFYLGVILIHDSFEGIRSRYLKYKEYIGEEKYSLDSLSISDERIDKCIRYFSEEGFDSEQINQIIAGIIRMGHVVKNIDEIKLTTGYFELFEVSKEERNHFISENVEWVYNDYSRDINTKFVQLINNYGKREGFQMLIQNPQRIRF